MKHVQIFEQEGIVMPSGRTTRVLVGDNGAVKGKYFCQGYVVIVPGGSIPLHDHEMEETYTILRGKGLMQVGDEQQHVEEGSLVLIPAYANHALTNTGDTDMHMMFVYAPYQIADHWEEELGKDANHS